jgi:hypothetical protein
MKIPFTVEQFFGVFEGYNAAIWPAQMIAYILGAVVVCLGIRENKTFSKVNSVVSALLWIWTGVLYHFVYFSRINPQARIFGTFFIIQGLLFFFTGALSDKLCFGFTTDVHGIAGACFMGYAMIVYPLIGVAEGHSFSELPAFGVAPCPLTIFTFGILLWANIRVPIYLLIIPFIWSLIGMGAALNLDVPQDYGLGVAGIIATILILTRNRRFTKLFQPEVSKERGGGGDKTHA